MRNRGFTVIEIVVSMGLFTIAGLLLFAVLQKGLEGLRVVEARRDTEQRLNNAQFWLRRDIEQASPSALMSKRVSGVPGSGDAIWFLSAEDPDEADPELRFHHHFETAEPVWQRTVLYYLVRPSSYAQVSGGLSAGIDPDPRRDSFAPHKFLIRKVIDGPEEPEVLMSASQIETYLTQPADYTDLSFAGEPGLVDARLIADGMLGFEVARNGALVEITTRAVRLQEAYRRVGDLGQVSLLEDPLTAVRETRIWAQSPIR